LRLATLRLTSLIRSRCRGESIPRKAPTFDGKDAVIEHRITFGDFERRELKQTLDAIDRARYVGAVKGSLETVGTLAVVAGLGWVGFQTWLIVNPPESDYKNPTGGHLYDAFLLRIGAISPDEYTRRVGEREARVDANRDPNAPRRSTTERLVDWFIFGNDDKFFIWDKPE